MDDDQISLSELQLALMRVLWTQDTCSAADMVQALRPERTLAYTTVATLLTRLERRGVVAAERDGRQLIYRALISEADVQRSMVSGLLSNLFEGKASALLNHLMQEDEINADDLTRMRKLLARRKDSDA